MPDVAVPEEGRARRVLPGRRMFVVADATLRSLAVTSLSLGFGLGGVSIFTLTGFGIRTFTGFGIRTFTVESRGWLLRM